jgi:hypothetical protein
LAESGVLLCKTPCELQCCSLQCHIGHSKQYNIRCRLALQHKLPAALQQHKLPAALQQHKLPVVLHYKLPSGKAERTVLSRQSQEYPNHRSAVCKTEPQVNEQKVPGKTTRRTSAVIFDPEL